MISYIYEKHAHEKEIKQHDFAEIKPSSTPYVVAKLCDEVSCGFFNPEQSA